MISRLLELLFVLHCFVIVVAAQNSVKRQIVLQVTNGGFIAFKSQTSATDPKRSEQTESLASLIDSQALPDENRIIHRVLTDAQQRVIFGYDLWVNSDPLTRKFSLAVLPADDSFRRSFLKDPTPPKITDLFATFPRSTRPQTLDDGDAISLELLVNQESGVKIVDVVRVTFDRSTLFETSPGAPPKDFSLDAVSLTVKSYELFIDEALVGKGKSTVGCTGSLLWFYVPDRGRFIISLVPREGYAFHKTGVLDDNRIEFIAKGQHYEWVSSAPILPNGGVWNIWVLEDPGYTPLFSSKRSFRKDDKSPSVLQRLGDAVSGRVGTPTPGLTATFPKESTKKSPVDIPKRMMVGGADSMDHLLPKSP